MARAGDRSDADLYRVLQVDPSAEPEVVEAAYRRLARKYHPDHNAGDLGAEAQMKRINEAFRILGNQDLRATYDAGHGFGLPELHITPPAVVLKAHDPNAREISFSVRIQQADGPAFDPAIHRIDLVLTAPWHEADVHWEWSNDRLPADVAFTLAFPDGFFKPATSLTGDIELAVRARDRT